MQNWIDTAVKVTPHRSLNVSRGVIRCRDFRDCSDDEILDALRSQGVTSVKHINSNKNGVLEPTNTVILTFNKPTAPSFVKAAYQKISVEPFIPNPLRCYNCQKFGHGKSTCNRHAVCARCCKEGHQDAECHDPPHCANCSGDHPSYSKECPEWIKQKEITSVKFHQGISFREARQVVEQRTMSGNGPSTASGGRRAGTTYAQAISSCHAATTQTDLTWPLDSKIPILVKDLIDVPAVPEVTRPGGVTQASQTSDVVTMSESAAGGGAAAHPSSSVKTVMEGSATAASSGSVRGASGSGSSDSSRGGGSGRGNGSAVTKTQQKPGPALSKTIASSRPPKGAADPVRQYNKYTSLQEMEMDLGPTPTTKRGH